ncbi:MAG: hypothetical protein BIFFINMI_01918 [Phycisphaerae bacterium]|nr:hypothetical protein [Phycisphaerae bacterium]
MSLRALVIGLTAGVLAGAIAVSVLNRGAAPPADPASADHAPALPEDAGLASRIVLQYHPQAGDAVAPIYARLLAALGDEVQVVWVCAGDDELADLRRRMGDAWPATRSRTVLVGKPISTWSKDRFVTLAAPGGRATLLAPSRERSTLDLRTNDGEIPWHLARQCGDLFGCRDAGMLFDGGDFLVAEDRVFAHPALIEKNADRFATPEALRRHIESQMGRPAVWLTDDPADAPLHHIGMFLTLLGSRAVVGDVRAAEPLCDAAVLADAGGRMPAADRDRLADQLDRLADRLAGLGYRVTRVPLMPSAAPRAWMSYNNGLAQTRGGAALYCMPTFGVARMDRAAAAAFESAGARVTAIDCSAVWRLGGSLRCLVNATGRGIDGRQGGR